MSEETIIRHCAPTLAGLKAGSLFLCAYETQDTLTQDLSIFRSMLRPKGLQILCARTQSGRALIYLYRPSALFRVLRLSSVARILSERGYPVPDPKACLGELFRRLRRETDVFPHEIGLFLGYPPDDVEGFIRQDRPSKLVGCWTVYGDVDDARRCFAAYRKCTDVYIRQWKRGYTLDRLTVASERQPSLLPVR